MKGLFGAWFKIIMEEYHIDTRLSYKYSIFLSYTVMSPLGLNLMLPLYRTDNDITNNFLQIRNGGISNTAGVDLTTNSMRLTRPPAKRSTDRALGKSMILAIAGSQELRINDKRKTENILFLEIRVRKYSGPHPSDSFSLAPILVASCSAIMLTSSCSVRAINITFLDAGACSRMAIGPPFPRIPDISTTDNIFEKTASSCSISKTSCFSATKERQRAKPFSPSDKDNFHNKTYFFMM